MSRVRRRGTWSARAAASALVAVILLSVVPASGAVDDRSPAEAGAVDIAADLRAALDRAATSADPNAVTNPHAPLGAALVDQGGAADERAAAALQPVPTWRSWRMLPGDQDDRVNAVAPLSDGGVLLAGDSTVGSLSGSSFSGDPVVARLDAAGRPVSSWGGEGDGIARLPVSSPLFQLSVRHVAPDPHGRVYVAGQRPVLFGGTDMWVLRLTSTGRLDRTFGGGDGISDIDLYQHDEVTALTTDAAGRALVALHSEDRAASPWRTLNALVRLNQDGTGDAAFGDGGFTRIGDPVESDHLVGRGTDLAVDAQQRVTVVNERGGLVQRFLATGAVDTAFGSNGSATIPSAGSVVRVVARIGGGAVGYSVIEHHGEPPALRLSALSADGRPDAGFGAGGQAEVPLGERVVDVANLEALPGGGVLLAGVRSQEDGGGAFVARALANGALDLTFGQLGVRTIAPGVEVGWPHLAVRPGGGPALAASPDRGRDRDLEAFAVTPLGATDTSFGAGGAAAVRVKDLHTPTTYGAAVDHQGRTVLSARTRGHSYLVRLATNGYEDDAFGRRGVVQLPSSASYHELLAARPDGSILLVRGEGELLDVDADGSPGARFDGSDRRTLPRLRADDRWHPTDAVPLADGSVLVAGHGGAAGQCDRAWIERLGVDGQRSTSFGDGGRVDLTPPGRCSTAPVGLTVGPDGRISLAHAEFEPGSSVPPLSVVIDRRLANGSPDTGFDVDGRVEVATPYRRDVQDLSVDADQRALVLTEGAVDGATSGAVRVDRLLVDGSPDLAFGVAGHVDVLPHGRASGVSVARDGALVVLASGPPTHYGGDVLLHRYLVDGTPDPAWGGAAGFEFTEGYGARLLQDGDGVITVVSAGYLVTERWGPVNPVPPDPPPPTCGSSTEHPLASRWGVSGSRPLACRWTAR